MPAMRQYCAELATAEDTWDMVRRTRARGKVALNSGLRGVDSEASVGARDGVGMCDIVHARRDMSWRDRA